jgi:hypothetical protein
MFFSTTAIYTLRSLIFDIFIFQKNSIPMQSVFCNKSLYKLTTSIKLRIKY